MKKVTVVRSISFVLCMLLMCSLASPALAATGYAASGSPTSGVYCNVNTISTTVDIKPYYATNTLHTIGYTTEIGVTQTWTECSESSAEISATVGVEYLSISASACASAGVSESVSHSIGVSIAYTIPATTASGRYRIEACFPRDTVHIVVTTYSPSVIQVVADKTITYMPRESEAYHRLTRYADA